MHIIKLTCFIVQVRLDVPSEEEMMIPDNIEEVMKDPALLERVHEVCIGWQQQIRTAIDQLQQKKQQGNGPLAEIDFWRERNAALSALVEQLKIPKVIVTSTLVDCSTS